MASRACDGLSFAPLMSSSAVPRHAMLTSLPPSPSARILPLVSPRRPILPPAPSTSMRPFAGGRQRRRALLIPMLLALVLLPFKASFATTLGHTSLVTPQDDWAVWTAMLACACLGLRAEKTRVGAALSSPLVTMFVSLILVNCGILPTSAPAYNVINKFLVPLAVPLLLFSADLRKVVKGAVTTITRYSSSFARLRPTVC
eukprot:747901-Hanusia_phi.AAC.2